MEKIAKSVWCFLVMLGRARAAAMFARQGNPAMAKAIMLERHECC